MWVRESPRLPVAAQAARSLPKGGFCQATAVGASEGPESPAQHQRNCDKKDDDWEPKRLMSKLLTQGREGGGGREMSQNKGNEGVMGLRQTFSRRLSLTLQRSVAMVLLGPVRDRKEESGGAT